MLVITAILFLLSEASKTVVYSFDAKNQSKDNYAIKFTYGAIFTKCNGQYVYGGYGTFKMQSTIMRNYILPPHYKLYLDVTFYRIDSWDADYFNIMLDNQLVYSQPFSYGSGTNLCGQTTYDDEIVQIQVQTKHNNNYAVIQFSAQDVNNDNNESWGISLITLSVEPCPLGCDYCESDSVQECNQWSLQYWDQRQTQFTYSNIQIYQIYYCNQLCQYTIALPQHSTAIIRFGVYIQYSFDINIAVTIDHLYNFTQYFNGSSVFTMISWTNIPAFAHFKNQINIQIIRQGGTQAFLYIKEFQLLIKKNLQKSIQLFPGCQTVIENTCWECVDSLKIDYHQEECLSDATQISQTYSSINNEQPNNWQEQYLYCEKGQKYDINLQQCLPVCGDFLIINPEQCDDGNNVPFDGCYNCQLECVQYCLKCDHGICQSCQLGFYLDSNSACQPLCGNGLLTPYLEQCDDGNNIQGDGCFNCQFECKEGGNSVKCLECETGFNIFEKQCIPICGDQIVIPEYEDCDDGNDIEGDGCFQCKFQCHPNCKNCYLGVCLDECRYGEILFDNQCKSLCGNSIISGSEQCDDGNLIQYDGCHECLYSCPLYCNYCEKGFCLECYDGYLLEVNNCKLIQNCGNGIIEGNEVCDDRNTLINDGCYQCQVEENYYCSLNSECQYSVNPIIIITFLNQSFSTQYVSITFSQEMFVTNQNQLLSEQLSINIEDLDEEFFYVEIHPILEPSSNLSFAQYVVGIKFLKQMNKKPKLNINLNLDIANKYNQKLKNLNSQIDLQKISYISSKQKEISEQLSKVNKYIIINTGAIGLLALFSGNSLMSQDILTLLQYYSYLKYIDLHYPSNLLIYFQSTDIISVSPILKLINFPDKFTETGVVSKGKFSGNSTNLIFNLSGQIIQLLSLLLLAIFIKLTELILYKSTLINKYFNWMTFLSEKYASQKPFRISKGLYFVLTKFLKSQKLFAKEGLQTIFILNGQDLTFKTFLSLYYQKLETKEDLVQVCLSLFIILTQIHFVLIQLFRNNQSAINVCIIQMVKNYIFFGSIIFCQNNQTQQTLSIICANTLNFIIIKNKFNLQMYSNIMTLSVEAFVMLFTLTSTIYLQDLQGIITEEIKLQIGWFHVVVLISGLTAQQFQFIIPKAKKIFSFLLQKLKEFKSKETKIQVPV